MQEMQKQIDAIMSEFDFKKVRTVMKALKWKWVRSQSVDRVPTILELKKEARRILDNVCSEDFWDDTEKDAKYYWSSCGGFTVRRVEDINPHPRGGGRLSLEFVLTDWEEEYDLDVIFEKEIKRRIENGISAFDGLSL